MKPVILYKKGCEPYKVDTQEALTFHLNQGWVENEKDIEAEPVPTVLTKPYNVLDAGPTAPAPADPGELKSLKEMLAAKDQQITDLTADFEEVITGLNATIARLKGDAPADFGLPVTPVVPKAPGAPDGPTNKELKAQLDVAGIKYGPQDNKATLTALLATAGKE